MTEPFELLEVIGRGGMGVVWKARDTATGELVAVKLLHAHYAEEPEYVQRIEREVEIAQRIDSPNVVRVLGYGQRNGVPYMVMEYVDGQSLRDLIRERKKLPWEGELGARAIAREIAKGLEAVHVAGIIHRDIKPSNVLISSDGKVKLADFGISRAIDQTRMTGSSTMLGTPAYMSPDSEAIALSDYYALGVVLYEMLAGVPPFEGESQQAVIIKHIREKPDLRRIPYEGRPLVAKLLAKAPTDRPQDTLTLRTLIDREPAWLTTPRVAAIAAAVVLGLAGGGTAFIFMRGGEAKAPTGPDSTPTASVAGMAETPTAGATATPTARTPSPTVIEPTAQTTPTTTATSPAPTSAPPTPAPLRPTNTPVPSLAASPTVQPTPAFTPFATPTITPTDSSSYIVGIRYRQCSPFEGYRQFVVCKYSLDYRAKKNTYRMLARLTLTVGGKSVVSQWDSDVYYPAEQGVVTSQISFECPATGTATTGWRVVFEEWDDSIPGTIEIVRSSDDASTVDCVTY